jgi:hypothetical protein
MWLGRGFHLISSLVVIGAPWEIREFALQVVHHLYVALGWVRGWGCVVNWCIIVLGVAQIARARVHESGIGSNLSGSVNGSGLLSSSGNISVIVS